MVRMAAMLVGAHPQHDRVAVYGPSRWSPMGRAVGVASQVVQHRCRPGPRRLVMNDARLGFRRQPPAVLARPRGLPLTCAGLRL